MNQLFVDEIEVTVDEKALSEIHERIMKSGFVSYRIDPKSMSDAAADYDGLSFEDKKRFLLEILDKNLLYVNYCDIDDTEFAISDADKAFTRSFYKEV